MILKKNEDQNFQRFVYWVYDLHRNFTIETSIFSDYENMIFI